MNESGEKRAEQMTQLFYFLMFLFKSFIFYSFPFFQAIEQRLLDGQWPPHTVEVKHNFTLVTDASP